MAKIVVAALYKFTNLDNYQALKTPLLNIMLANNVKGTVLLAKEGINGTVAGSREEIDALLNWLKSDPRFADIDHKESFDDEMPFYRTKVKLKREIVTMGIEGIDPKKVVGTYIKPQDWNQLISDPEVTVIDTRNDYEVQIGTFDRAINPHTESFRDFPQYVKEHLDPTIHKKVAMFCTGGIRCEKSTAYLKEQGFAEVYHLQGGILNYLEKVSPENSLWRGDCFVFDNRVAVDHSLQKGHYDQCHACRLPITDEDKQSQFYEKGISCPHCFDKQTEQQKQRFWEREKQVQLAIQRGEKHIGAEAVEAQELHRKLKLEEREKNRLRNKS